MRWAYNIRAVLTVLFFVILPWQTRWIYRASPIHPDAEWGRLSLYASELLLGVLLVWAIAHAVWLWRRGQLPWQPFTRERLWLVGALAVIVYGAARSWFTVDPAAGFQHTWWILEAILVVIFLRTGWFPWRAAITGLLIGLSIAALLGVYQAVGQYAPGNKWLGLAEHRPEWGGSSVVENTDGRFLRAYGSFPHPNVFGGYLVLALFVILTVLDSSARSLRMTSYMLTALFSIALALSFSRGAWIAWLVAMGVVLYERRRAVVLQAALSAITIAAILVTLWPVTVTRFIADARLEQRAIDERVMSVRDGFEMWKTAPWFGVGPTQYMNTFYVQHPDTPWWQLAPPHNVGIAILVEYGAVGTLLLIGALILFGWHFIQKGRYRAALLFLPLLALAQFDHYPWSLYSGVMLVALYVGFHAHIIHTIPTVGTQIRY